MYSKLEEKMISTQDKTADDPFYPHVISGDLSCYMIFGTYSRPAEEGRWYHHTAPDCLSPTGKMYGICLLYTGDAEKFRSNVMIWTPKGDEDMEFWI